MTKYYLWFLLFYLFTEPRASRENDAPVMVTGILGESAILPTEIPNGYKLENINWASRTSVALVQPEGQSVKIITTHQNYRDRLNVPPNTYNLKISPLKMEDAGSYRADINLQNPTTSTTFTITKNYTLHVYRQLAPPKITLTFVASENNTCNISLTCFMEEGGEAVKYQWTPLGEQAVESNGKSSLFIFQRPKDAPINYTCTAINPVTNNSQSKFVQYPCAGTLVIFDPFWYTLLSVLEMVIVIILTGMGFYLRHKKKQEPRASRENDAPVMVTGILGESAILPTEIPNGYKLENINWASRTSVALVQPEGQSVKIITTHQNYRDRLNVPPNTYNLKISPLKMEDAGSYRADINLQNPTTSTTFTVTKNYTLHVYRRLAPPKITLTFVASENNTCNITLTCFMEEKGEAVKYQWTPLGEQAVESNGKSSLFIFQRPEDAPINYICTAINPVTNNSQSKLVQYPCAGMPMSSRSLWFILVPVLVLVPSAGILFYLQHKKKKDADSPSTSKVMALKDLPLSENQLYDEISMPKAIVSNPPKEEEALNTIYYTVQKPQKIKNSCSSATKLLGTSTNDSVI
ncbi:SLAM family member 5-like isoform X2 [Vombatus ursinus]|uniref:SLAM family member 5-like isoform X2 n=1 Tax=Vombatus ursinus TaxID=29139 RepID=UPI000FFD0F82|nr:SLAM family member 5-like isoform X2 [Vombatus ursinus]